MTRTRLLGLAPLILLAGVLSYCAGTVRAADGAPGGETAGLEIVELKLGFADRYKLGCWTPLEVTLRAGGESVHGQLVVTTLDGDAVPSRYQLSGELPIELAPGESKTVRLNVKLGQRDGDCTIEVRQGEQVAISRRFVAADAPLTGRLTAGQGLIVAIGSPLVATDEALLAQRGAVVSQLKTLDELPSDWWAYEGVDAVVIGTTQEETNDRLVAASPQLGALAEWVRMGGRLILSVGRNAPRVLSADSALGALVPGKLSADALVPLRQSTALETYADSSEPLMVAGPRVVQVPKLEAVRGRIEAFAGSQSTDLPLVVRAPRGFGECVFLAFDLGEAPLAGWPGRGDLIDKLLRRPRAAANASETGSQGQVTTLGFVDISGQLRGALDQFEGVGLVPFWLVAVLVLAYIACIGPVDYFLVKRLLRRMEATWLTSAVIVLAFSAGAYALAVRLKGHEVQLNGVDVIDFDAESKLVRGTSWFGLYSPRVEAYDLSLEPSRADWQPAGTPRALLSWFGLPGTGFGGMESSSVGARVFTEPYDFSATDEQMSRVPIAVWSSKALVARWWSEGDGKVTAELRDNGRLAGTLASSLAGPLDDCVLLYDDWAYPLRTLRPGASIQLESEIDPQKIDTYLKHITVSGDRTVLPLYDRASFDVPRTVEIMAAFELAGGEKYTGLSDSFQRFVDLSPAVKMGRAVLMGRSATQGTQLLRDGAPLQGPGDRRWTVYRFVFPVEQVTEK